MVLKKSGADRSAQGAQAYGRMRLLALLVALMPLSVAHAAEVFDLTCHGLLERAHIIQHPGVFPPISDEIVQDDAQPWNSVFHIDLPNRVFVFRNARMWSRFRRSTATNWYFSQQI
jgi:hypothetical protein